jgi:regulator of sigma E protease
MLFYTGVTLGVLVFVHELGHFLAARMCGMRVDRFSIGFPPRAFGKKIGDTDYCVSWIPLGGYVKIAGMVDESMDTEFVNNEPQPWEFRAKPMWMRTIVLSAGVIMNILLAILIFWNFHFVRGKDIMETTEIGYVTEGSPAAAAGVHAGDKIVAVNGYRVTHWDEFQSQLYLENLGNDITLTLERGGQQVSAFIPSKSMPGMSEGPVGISIGQTVPVISIVESGMPAAAIGLKPGDTLATFNGEPIRSRDQIISYIKNHGGKPLTLSWKRGTETLSGTGTITKEGRIGISIGSAYVGPIKHISYSILGAFPEGLNEVGQSIRLFGLTLSKLFAGKTSVKESFGGPIAIAQIATQSAELGLQTFLWFMAQLSVTLAVMNILPIPALDGGHLAMLLVEKAMHREIPHRVKIAIQQAGFILLLAFMAFIIYNDITRF